MSDNKPTFKILSTEEYNASKEAGLWPVASIVAVRSDFPNADGTRNVYFIEAVLNPENSWVTKNCKGKEGDALDREVEDIKHASWALVDALHQHSLTVMESGTHIFGFDEGRPECVAGAVAAWTRNPKFAKFAPIEGWAEVIWRNGHYLGGVPLNYGQSTKHDYVDMIVTNSANFHISVPPFLGKWAETVVDALSKTAEESLAHSRQKMQTWSIKQDVYQTVAAKVAYGSVAEVGSISMVLVDGTALALSSVTPGDILYFYRKVDGENVYQCYVTWDGSEKRRGAIAEYARRGSLVSLNKALAL